MNVIPKEQIMKEIDNIQGDSNDYILIDEEEIEIMLKNQDIIVMDSCEINDKNAAFIAVSSIMSDFQSSIFSSTDIEFILIYFNLNYNYGTMKLYDSLEETYKIKNNNLLIDDKPDLLSNFVYDENLDPDYIKVTVFFGLYKTKS